MTDSPAYYSTSVLLKQPQIGIQTEQIVTLQETERAWKEQLAAVDNWEASGFNEDLREEMDQALAFAEYIEALYHNQYQRRVTREDGSWYVIPKYTEAFIKGHLYKVEVLHTVNVRGNWAVQLRTLPIDGWLPRPFDMAYGMDPLNTGSVPLENVRIDGMLLGVK
jgi:hypothetical protein